MALTEVDAARLNDNVFNTVGPFKNRIINGDMRIDQRNAGASVTITTANQYTVDRWQGVDSVGSKFSVVQSTTAPAGFTHSALITSLSAYSAASGDYRGFRQRIEGFNVGDLGWGAAGALSVTLSFWVRSSLTGTFGGSLVNDPYNRSYPFTYAINSANTWEYKTITVAGDTTGTWNKNSSAGIDVVFDTGAGSSSRGTAGAWAGTGYWGATGAVSLVGTNGATFYITGVQLEAGSVATPFERRSYGQELMLAQRYYSKSFPATSAFPSAPFYDGNMGWGQSIEAARVSMSVRFPAEMRATPTVTIYSPTSLTAGTFRVWQAAVDRNGSAGGISSTGFAWIDKSGAADLSPTATQTSAVHYIATAEL